MGCGLWGKISHLGAESISCDNRAQTVDENGYFFSVSKRVWAYIKEFLFLYPGIYDFVGHFKKKEYIKAHNVFRTTHPTYWKCYDSTFLR